MWIPLAFGDDLPIVAVRPTNPPMTAKPRRWLVYLAETTRSASRIRDDAMIRLMPRIRLIDIDCGDIRAYQTRISQESQRYLVRLGREAAERALESYGRDLANVHRAVMPGPRASEQDSVAEAFGLRLITDSYRTLSKEVRNQIFISYSHEDGKWRDELRKHLAPLRNTALLEWDDTKIPWGEDWREEIEQALAATRIAVLLVTPTYLSSDFINTTELPLIFAARKRGDLQVVPIAIRHSVVEGTALAELQFANDLAAPLSTFKDNERDRMLSELCLKITKRMQAA